MKKLFLLIPLISLGLVGCSNSNSSNNSSNSSNNYSNQYSGDSNSSQPETKTLTKEEAIKKLQRECTESNKRKTLYSSSSYNSTAGATLLYTAFLQSKNDSELKLFFGRDQDSTTSVNSLSLCVNLIENSSKTYDCTYIKSKGTSNLSTALFEINKNYCNQNPQPQNLTVLSGSNYKGHYMTATGNAFSCLLSRYEAELKALGFERFVENPINFSLDGLPAIEEQKEIYQRYGIGICFNNSFPFEGRTQVKTDSSKYSTWNLLSIEVYEMQSISDFYVVRCRCRVQKLSGSLKIAIAVPSMEPGTESTMWSLGYQYSEVIGVGDTEYITSSFYLNSQSVGRTYNITIPTITYVNNEW